MVSSNAMKPLAVHELICRVGMEDRGATSCGEDFRYGGVSYFLGASKRGEAIFAKGFSESIVMDYLWELVYWHRRRPGTRTTLDG